MIFSVFQNNNPEYYSRRVYYDKLLVIKKDNKKLNSDH